MEDVKIIQQERTQLFKDIYDGRIPKRVPIRANLSLEFCIQYAGLSLAEIQWTLAGVEKALNHACQISNSDAPPFGYARYPAHFHIMGAKTFVMGSNGFIQHPEVHGMEVSDYDDFIKNPYDCLMEKVLPRLYPELNADPITRSLIFAKAIIAYLDYSQKYAIINNKLTEQYGFYPGPKESNAAAAAPFDFLSDFLRGFSGICTDVRRYPEKVAEACEALLPLQIKKGIPPIPSKYGQTFIPLHMATFLRTKDFEKLFWPSLLKLVNKLAEAGQPCYMFCEHDWMRYLDYLAELPEGTRLYFEYGDPRIIKNKIGKRHIISGLYPLTYLKTATKEQCIDKVKELLDIMAPGGNYIFSFDKSPLSLSDINVENYVAVLKYVVENSNYNNAGESVTTKVKPKPKEILVKEETPKFTSKYYRSSGDHCDQHLQINSKLGTIINPILQGYEEVLFDFLARLV